MPNPILADVLDLPGIAHGFFTRTGGVSQGIYDSLNCGLGSKDEAEAVKQNRQRVALSLGAPAQNLVTLYQIHSDVTVVAVQPIAHDKLPRADAVVTRTPGLVVGALAADCAPVLLADPVARVVGAAHAGWRGAVGGILESVVTAMQDLGADRRHIRAAVGPCIGQAAYQVGPEFEADFLARDTGNAVYFIRPSPGARPHFDLSTFVGDRLRRMHLGAVMQQSYCTFEDESRLFSYRRSQKLGHPDYGRQISAIVLT
jgi:YfiH family protein